MKSLIDKIICLHLLLIFSITVSAQKYVQVGFKDDGVIPIKIHKAFYQAADGKTKEIYKLSCTNKIIEALFNKYDIIEFEKEYPTAIKFSHPSAKILNRVYRVRLRSSAEQLFQELKSASLNDLDNISLAHDPISFSSVNPNDYYSCFTDRVYVGLPCASEHLDLINAKGAWEYTRGLSCITIGITDVLYKHHTDLDAKVLNINNLPAGVTVYAANYNFGNNRPHGTEVAGTAAALTDNGSGISGIGNKVTLRYYPMSLDGALQAAYDGCKVINGSWGSTSSTPSDQSTVNMIHDLGVTLVFAAGNGAYGDNTSYYYPASYANVISVTSVGSAYPVQGFYYTFIDANPPFNAGINWIDCHEIIIGRPQGYVNTSGDLVKTTYQHNDSVDICAPGLYNVVLGNNNAIEADAGTSISSPMVAGAAALLYSINANFTPDQITSFLKQSAKNIYNISTNTNYVGKLGAGRLDAGAAAALAAPSGCLPSFTNITWKSGTTNITNNTYYTYLATNSVLNFRVPAASVAPGATVEWEFKSGSDVVTKTGTNVNLTWGTDFSAMVGPNQRYDVYPLEVYVRQGSSSCCYSAYYKEKGYSPNVLNPNSPASYPEYNCKGTIVYNSGVIPSSKVKAGNIYLGSNYGTGTSTVSNTPNLTTYFLGNNSIDMLPGFSATVTGNGYFHLLVDPSKCSLPSQGNNFTSPKTAKNNEGEEANSIQYEDVGNVQENLTITKIFPNPVIDNLYISLQSSDSQPVQIKILNGAGQTVKSVSIFTHKGASEKFVVSMKGLAAGVYFIQITNKKQVLNGTIIKGMR